MVAGHLLLLCLVGIAAASSAADAAVKNKFYARFYPRELDPNKDKGYYVMPRTTAEARADGWAAVPGNRSDHTTLWARRGDYRVCLLFDRRGGVAGIQVSASKAALKKSGIPFDYNKSDYWFEQTLLGVPVYSATAYFVSKGVLAAGGRKVKANTPTAPDFQLLYKTHKGHVSRLAVPDTEKAMLKKKWIKQGCYPGQGYHVYQDLTHKSKCADFKPYFFVTSPTRKDLTSFGFSIWGRADDSTIRPWFENQLSANIQSVIFNKPACFNQWVDTYGLWVMHVFFEDKPWDVKCV